MKTKDENDIENKLGLYKYFKYFSVNNLNREETKTNNEEALKIY